MIFTLLQKLIIDLSSVLNSPKFLEHFQKSSFEEQKRFVSLTAISKQKLGSPVRGASLDPLYHGCSRVCQRVTVGQWVSNDTFATVSDISTSQALEVRQTRILVPDPDKRTYVCMREYVEVCQHRITARPQYPTVYIQRLTACRERSSISNVDESFAQLALASRRRQITYL